MMEDLFKRPTILARYLQGPHAEAREEFLNHCARQGYSHSALRKIAWILLVLAHSIDIDRGNVTTQDIELAVDHRMRFNRQAMSRSDSASERQMFVHFATQWMQRLGCLAQAPEIRNIFAAQIDAFARYMRDERGLSPVTISTRCDQLTWFLEGLDSRRETLEAITVADVDAFLEQKGKQGWTRPSLAALADSLRSFFSFAEARGWCAPGITAVIESPRLYAREGIPQGPAWQDVQRLLASTGGDHPVDIRDHAILMLLALYGMRRGEVAGLQLESLDWEGGIIRVARPKQRLTQRYPFLPAVGNAILRYLQDVRPRCEHRALFLALKAPYRPLSAASITHIARSHLSRLGMTLSPRGAHCLRHACAGHLLSSGFSLKQIGDHLGHRSADSTLSYTKVDLVGLRQIAELDLGRLL
jgi:site-specific recombinase XerD